jgi:beta-lactamase class A
LQSRQSSSESWVLKRSGAIAYRDEPFDPRAQHHRHGTGLALVLAAAVLLGFGANAISGHGVKRASVASASAATPEEVRLTSGPAPTYIAFPSKPGPTALQARLDELAKRYREPVGVAVTDVTGGWVAAVNATDTYPQQSVSKLWVVLSVFDAIDQGKLHLADQIRLDQSDRSVFYQPLASRIGKDGYTTTLEDLIRRALIESDNAANDRLIKAVGGVDVVTATIARKGLAGIAVGATEHELQARTAGMVWRDEYGRGNAFKEARAQLPDGIRDVALQAYLANPGDGASPMAIATGLTALRKGLLLSPESTRTMISIMSEATTGRMRLKGGLPDGWSIAHKTGTGPDWKTGSVGINDVALLTAPDGHTYAVAVMMRQTRQGIPARLAFMQAVTRAVVAAWESDHGGPGALPPIQMASLRSGHTGGAD